MAPPLVDRNTGDVIPADDHNDVKDYIEDAAYRINTQYLQLGGSHVVIDQSVNGSYLGSVTADNFIGNGSELVDIDSGNVRLPQLNNATYNNLTEFFNLRSSGRISGGSLTDNGDGTLSIGSGTGLLKNTDNNYGSTFFIDWVANGSLTLTDNSINYVYVDYNSGSPAIGVETTYNPNSNSRFYLGKAYRNGTTIDIVRNGLDVSSTDRRINTWAVDVFGEVTRANGIITSETGTRNIAVSSGTLYAGFDANTFPAFDSSTGSPFVYFYRDGVGGWNRVTGQTQIDNIGYDDGTGTLGSVSNNHYGIHWVYADFDDAIHVVYGQGDYNKLSDAQSAQPPSNLPDQITDFGLLSAKIILLRDASTFTEIESAFDEVFTSSPVTDHSDLAGLSGDDHPQYVLRDGTGSMSGDLFVSANGSFAGSLIANDWSDVSITESQISDLSHYTSSDFNTDFSAKSTTDLSEGTNLYYTDARVSTVITGSSLIGSGDNISLLNNDAAYITDYTVTELDVTQHEGAIDHDALTNFVVNEHIDWTSTSNSINTTGSVVATYGSFNNINLVNYIPQGVLPTGSIPDLEGTYITQGVLPVGSVPNITASKVTDFDTEVSNNTDVSSNTTHRTSDGTDHTYINQDVRTTSSPTFVSGSYTGSVEANEIAITQGQKFYLNGASGNTYLSFDGTNVDLYVNGVLKQRWS